MANLKLQEQLRQQQLRKFGLGGLGIMLFAALWEGYKALGTAVNGKLLGFKLPARTDDASMPHLSTILSAFGKKEVEGQPGTVFGSVVGGTWFTLRLAVVGFIIGATVGIGLAVLMQRFKLIERAWLPYVVLSQTVPLIALAPLIVAWGGRLKIGGAAIQPWMVVSAMAAYLSFFPIAVGALKGLQSPKPHSLELMDSYAASSFQTLIKLRLPSAMPFLIPALKLGAAASVVGAVVSEISLGKNGGIGRLILNYFQKATGDPSRVFTAFAGAAVLGLVVAGIIGLFERYIMRNYPKDQTA
jgi:NitT/TauT family transport system permease protein